MPRMPFSPTPRTSRLLLHIQRHFNPTPPLHNLPAIHAPPFEQIIHIQPCEIGTNIKRPCKPRDNLTSHMRTFHKPRTIKLLSALLAQKPSKILRWDWPRRIPARPTYMMSLLNLACLDDAGAYRAVGGLSGFEFRGVGEDVEEACLALVDVDGVG